MTKNEKDLVIKDLCARLPYDVIVDYAHNAYNIHKGYYIEHGSKCILSCYLLDVFISPRQNEEGEYIKPYLLPLSSMTEEQKIEYNRLRDFTYTYHYEFGDIVDDIEVYDNWKSIDYLNANHFDYRYLIDQGLAIDATGLDIY